MFKPKGHHVRQSQVEKFTRYSIRKVSFGAASVAVATGLFFLGGGSVQAAEPVTNPESTEVQNPQNVNEKSSAPSKEVAGQESATDTQASAVETPNGVTEKVAINTASLEDLVAQAESRLSKLTEGKKTKSVIDDAKNLVNKAKELLNDDTKTQAKVDALAKQLSSSLVILNSIKSEATEEKENKNQDPRNGQAISGKGESGFRTVDTTAANAASEAEKYKGIRDAAIPELQANIDKIQAQIAKEEAKPTDKKDQFKIDVLKGIKQKAEKVITTANAADTTSAQKMSQQAEAVKSERDLLALYLAGKADLGAPVSENHVAYGNNPTNGVFESLKEGFGDRVTFDDAVSKSETIAKQQAGPGDINARSEGIGSATYNWKEKTITKADAETGVLNGWKIENGEKVTAVKPLDVTNITDKDGASSTRTVPKSKIYTNDGELIQYQSEGHQLSYNAGSGIIPTITPTIDAMRTNAFGEVKNRDYYLELGSKGTTISKEFDVNGNSRLNVNLIHSAAYGHASTPSTGEKVKLKIVDAFTGEEIKPVDGKNGPVSTEAGPAGGNGWSSLARIYDIPSKTTKIKVLIEAADQGTGLTTNPFNRKGAEIKDGYLVGGIGIATAPAAEIVTDVSSGRNKNEYGYTPDTIYEKNQKGSFNFTLKDTAGMNIDYYAASKVQVTVKVPKGVVLEDRVINANGGSAFLGGVYANSIRWTPNDPNDNSKGGTLTYDVPAGSRMAAAEKTTRSSSIVFTTADNFIGPADFKVIAKSGFGDTDAEGNRLYSYTSLGLKPEYENQFHRGGLANSDNPDFEYGKVIYINSLQATGTVTVPINTNDDQLKEVAKAKATELVEAADFKGKLPAGATVTVGDITEAVAETLTNEKGTNKGVVNVPATYTVDGTTYNTTIPVTINVLGSEPKTVYTVEGKKLDAEKVKNAVTPGTGGTVNAPKETDLPATTVKAGTPDVTVPTTVTYSTGDETVNVPVEVLPKATPEKVTTLKDTTSDNLTTAVKEKAQAALGKLTLPSGVTAELDPTQTYTVPATTSNGDKDNVPVKVQYKDATGTVVAEDTINVPVTVVSSTPSKIVVFEGDEVTADTVKGAVTPGTDGTKGTPVIPTDLTKQSGEKEVTVPVTYDGITGPEQVKVPVTVLPKPEADEILVPKKGDKEKAKEKVLAQAEKAIADGTFTGKLPQGARVEIDKTAPVTVPDLTDDTKVEVTVKYTVPGQDEPLTTTVKVPVTVVEGVPQIVPVKETNDVLPDPEKSIDKEDYPEGSTFRYKTPEGQTTPIDVTTTGDKNVVVEVLDPQGNPIAEVPATVRVVDSTPQFVVADPTKKQPEAKDSITPGEYPEGTTFEYKTPVDTTTSGEKDVTVVAKLNGQPIAEVPAKVVVVDPKTQYVVADPSKPQPDASKSIDPEQYPEGTTFEYKTPVDTTTPGEKDVVVVAKDGEDKLVEVPTKVKVVQGYPQIVPVDEDKKQPSPEDSIDPNDYPDDATFEYKEEVDTSTPGDKKVTVVVKQGDKVLVEVPSTVRVVESYPKYVPVDPAKKQPDPKENINPNDFPTGTTFEYKDNTPVDTTTPGEKDVTVVAKLNGQPITEIPAKIVVVESKTQYVPVNAEGDKKPKPQDSITPDDYPEGSTFEYKTPEGQTTPYDGTTPGEKDVTVVVKDSDGDPIVEVPAKIKVVQGKEQLTPVNAEDKDKPKAEDSITPSDYPEGSTFEYKVPEGQTTPYDGTTPGDKPVTVVVKDKDGKVLVEVPATIKVVETKPTPIETPVTNTPLTEDDYTKGMKIPEGATVKVGDLPDLTTPGEKTPVKVTITLPNDKSYTVDVPVTVTPVKEIETPVTTEKLTPEDILKQVKVPEGATAKVGDLPDLTTSGKKDPVKVTVTLPNGKEVTVDVPVNVTPVKEIETPVTTEKLTPEDVLKQIKVPEGATAKVGDLPDLTTSGKKDPVKVTVTLPNGKVVTVDVPVNVTPIKEIETPVTTAKLTPEDILKQVKVPEGATTKVENIPDLTTPGKKDPVKVTVTLPNGKVVTVDVPVNVTPIKEIETPVTTDKLTPEDILKQIKVPEGATTKVENIPDLTTPGKKDPVKVTVTLPNGKVVTVEVPVNVTPIKEIETPVTTDKLTPEDILKQIKVPEGATTKVENIPDLTTPGKKDPVKVTITLPNGKVVTVEVPVNVTPITPIETPVTKDKLTPEDILKQIKVPEGATVKVENIPDLTTPGKKDPVKVTITLPNGKVVIVEVPVNVTPIKDIVKKQGDPVTAEDVENHIPKGAKVISIGDKPTTDVPGERPSIPVVIELPNGIRVTMNIPVIVTPKVTPIVVEVGTPITENDVKKRIDLPKGWEIVEVGKIPSTETPGAKPVVKVKVKLPDGRIITVEVPVTVTPKSQNGGGVISQNGDSTVQIVTEYLDENGNRITSDKEGKHNPIELEGYEFSHSTTDAKGNTLHHYKKVKKPINQETPTSPEKPVATPVQTSSTDSQQVAETTVANDKKELPNTGTEDKAGLASLGLLGMLSAFGLVARKKKED